jgi:hypothetical protein
VSLRVYHQQVAQFNSILLTVKMKTAVALMIIVVALSAIYQVDAQAPFCKFAK